MPNIFVEFMNRIDETVVFHPLDEEQIKIVAKIQIARLADRLANRELTINVSAE